MRTGTPIQDRGGFRLRSAGWTNADQEADRLLDEQRLADPDLSPEEARRISLYWEGMFHETQRDGDDGSPPFSWLETAEKARERFRYTDDGQLQSAPIPAA